MIKIKAAVVLSEGFLTNLLTKMTDGLTNV